MLLCGRRSVRLSNVEVPDVEVAKGFLKVSKGSLKVSKGFLKVSKGFLKVSKGFLKGLPFKTPAPEKQYPD